MGDVAAKLRYFSTRGREDWSHPSEMRSTRHGHEFHRVKWPEIRRLRRLTISRKDVKLGTRRNRLCIPQGRQTHPPQYDFPDPHRHFLLRVRRRKKYHRFAVMITLQKAWKEKNFRHGFHGLTRYFIPLEREEEYHLCNLCVAAGDPCQKNILDTDFTD
jgi:hypothetical protein